MRATVARVMERGGKGPMKAALIIPALNEEAAIGPVLDELPAERFCSVIVADNGSTDRTRREAATRGARVTVEPRRGYGAACLSAMRALPDDAEIVVFMDGDGSDDPADLDRLLRPIRDGQADFVVGSRVLARSGSNALHRHQRLGNWLATRLLRLLLGHRYTDLGPFRAIRADCLRRLRMRDRGYGWTVEMQIRALRAGLRIAEVPVTHRPRLAGHSKVSGSVKASLLAGCKILWTVARGAAGG